MLISRMLQSFGQVLLASRPQLCYCVSTVNSQSDSSIVVSGSSTGRESNGGNGYHEIYERLLQDISAFRLRPGSMLPSLRDLSRQYHVGVTPVRRALDRLAAEGAIVKQHGKGNFVREIGKLQIALLTVSRYYREPLTSGLVREINADAAGFEVTPACLSDMGVSSVRRFQSENNMPCIVLATGGFETMARDDLLVPMDEMFGFDELLADLPDNLDYRHIGGDGLARHYWLPLFLHPTAFALNRDLARQSGLPDDRGPYDWADLLDWSKTFQRFARDRHGVPRMTYGLHNQFVSPNLSYLAMGGGDSHISSDLDELSRANVEGFISLFARLASDGAMVFPQGATNVGHELFADGDYLCHLSALPWFAYEAERYNPDMDYAFFPIPPARRGGPRISNCSSVRLGIVRPPNGSIPEITDACWNVCASIVRHRHIMTYARDLKSLPAQMSHRSAAIESNPRLAGFYDAMADAQFPPTSAIAQRRRFAADALLTPFIVGHQMLDNPAHISRLLRDMINNMDWELPPD